MIVEKDEFVRAKVTGGATVGQLRRALQEIPDDAVIHDVEISEFDYREVDPFPLKFEMRLEWVRQPSEADIPERGGESHGR